METKKLLGRRIAFLATDGFDQIELTQPWNALKAAGASVHLISLRTWEIRGRHSDGPGDLFLVEKSIDNASADDYEGLLLPGGERSTNSLRNNKACTEFVREFFKAAKPVAAISLGSQALIDADVVDGRRMTSDPSIKSALIAAGADWVDEACVCEEGLVTSRGAGDLNLFCEKAIEEFAEGIHVGQIV